MAAPVEGLVMTRQDVALVVRHLRRALSEQGERGARDRDAESVLRQMLEWSAVRSAHQARTSAEGSAVAAAGRPVEVDFVSVRALGQRLKVTPRRVRQLLAGAPIARTGAGELLIPRGVADELAAARGVE